MLSRAKVAFTEAADGRTAARRLAIFVIWKAYVGFVADSASFTAHHSWGLVFAGQSAPRLHQAFAKGRWT